jgi:hypothetical protein
MASALSTAYVLLGKATMSDPPDWSTAVGAIHTLSSMLTCTDCGQVVGSHPHVTPEPFAFHCDHCHEVKNDQDAEMLTLLMENIKNLCSYVLKGVANVTAADDDSDDDSEVELNKKMKNKDIVVVPTHTSRAKFVSKLRRFSRIYLDLATTADAGNGIVIKTEIKEEPVETVSVTAPPVPKAVIVTSQAKNYSNNGQWIKIRNTGGSQHTQPVKRGGHVVINGSKFGRDQIVKTTLRPSLTYPFKAQNGVHLNNGGKAFSKLSDYLIQTTTGNDNKAGGRIKQNGGGGTAKMSDYVVQLSQISSSSSNNGHHNHHHHINQLENKSNKGHNSGGVGGKKGCRCGNATPTPGKLTCGGQRCPCYVESKECLDCKCKGCRNPHRANGEKVIRPHLQVKTLHQNPLDHSTFYITTTSSSSSASSSTSSSSTAIKRIHLNSSS